MGFKVSINANRIKFSACHFLKEPLQCSRLHGHNYYVSVEVSSDLDENYFVVDFIELKERVESIVRPLDHYILIPKNSNYIKIKEDDNSVEVITDNKRYVFPRSEVVFLPLPATTSELLAKYIHDNLKEIYKNKKILVKIEESKNNIAIYED
ncbi:MAG: 6-pyruvoyl tetrahydropterin synthase family protein [Candidatus Hodarchaeota archaeon]